MRSVVIVATLGCVPFFAATAQELPGLRPGTNIEYSPYLQEDFPNQVFFGDTHLHTSFSADAGLVGATTTPDDAFLFLSTLADGARDWLEKEPVEQPSQNTKVDDLKDHRCQV